MEFIANVKDVKSRNLVSGDKEYKVVLQERNPRIMELDKARPVEEMEFKVSFEESKVN